jgi:hypothetical protein
MTDRTTVMNKLLETAKLTTNVISILQVVKNADSPTIQKTFEIYKNILEPREKDFLKLIYLMNYNDIQTYFNKKWDVFYNENQSPLVFPFEIKDMYITPIVNKISEIPWSQRMTLLKILDSNFNVKAPQGTAVGGKKKSFRKKTIKRGRRRRAPTRRYR